MEQYNSDLAIASEGSFGPHPQLFFGYCNEEWLVIKDKKNNAEWFAKIISTFTSFLSSLWWTPLTLPIVPTGIKIGVSIIPWSVCNNPALALEDLSWLINSKCINMLKKTLSKDTGIWFRKASLYSSFNNVQHFWFFYHLLSTNFCRFYSCCDNSIFIYKHNSWALIFL